MPSPEPTSQERGFRPALWGFDKNDVLAYMNALANESQQQELMYQEQVKQLQDQVEKLKDAQTKARICVETLQGDLAKALSRAEAAEARADDAGKENTVLNSQLTAAEEKAESYAGRYQEARQSNAEAQLRIRDMQKELEALKAVQTSAIEPVEYVPPVVPEPQPAPVPVLEHKPEPAPQPVAPQPAPVAAATDATVTEQARIEARKILMEARLKAEQAEQRISDEARAQKLRMADNARDLAAGVLLLKERLAGVDDKLNAATLDLDNATAAIYSALDSTAGQISELERGLNTFGDERTQPAEKPAPPKQEPPQANRTLRPKVTAQPVARRAKPQRKQEEPPHRLRRTGQHPYNVSQDLLDAIDRLDNN